MAVLDSHLGDENYPYNNRTQVANKGDKAGIAAYLGKRVACHRPHFWGNQYPINDTQDRVAVIKLYMQNLWRMPEKISRLHELTGHLLICYCKPQDCHCDILAAFADTFGAAQLAGLGGLLPNLQELDETDTPVLSFRHDRWAMVWGASLAQGKDLYSVVRAVLDDFLAHYIGRAIGDISGGRINANNITPEEWAFVEEVEHLGWFVPNREQWWTVRNLLGLFELRRGFSTKYDPVPYSPSYGYTVQGGTAQIRLGYHGRRALEEKRRGKVYEAGLPLTMEQLSRWFTQAEREMLE